MNKKIFATGEVRFTVLLHDYLAERMPDIEFCSADSTASDDKLYDCLKGTDSVILLHEVGVCDASVAKDNLLFTKRIVETLVTLQSKATVAYFAPRKISADSGDFRSLKMYGEEVVRGYATAGNAKTILYKMPEIFGPSYDNDVIDKLIKTKKVENPEHSYDFLHSSDLMNELYRMINGVPATTGYDCYALPKGAHLSTEGTILKKITEFDLLKPYEIPDFPSTFDRRLYDYYLQKTDLADSYELESAVDAAILSSQRFGTVRVKRLSPTEKTEITLDGVSYIRLLLLCGSIKTCNGTYCADNNVIRLDLKTGTMVENVGSDPAIIEIWSYNRII